MRSYHSSVLLVLVVTSAWAQSGNVLASVPRIQASGEGVVQVKPDQAKIDIGVVTQAPTAQAAGAQNATQLQSAIVSLRAVLGGNTEIKTTGYSLSPVYSYPQNGKPSIEGYRAVDTIEVTMDDFTVIGKVIDAATKGGANEVQRLQFTLKNDSSARAAALAKAVHEARSNAAAMAGAMGVKLGRLISLEQGASEGILPVAFTAEARVAAVPTPVQADTIEVRASVTLTMAVE